MDDLRPDALATVAARVVAWHNRHPLARRITAEQVQSIGYVALPYLAPAEAGGAAAGAHGAAAAPAAAHGGAAEAGAEQGKSLRERAQVRAQSHPPGGPPAAAPAAATAAKAQGKTAAKAQALKPAFTEDFIAPLALRRVSRWVARHGAQASRAPRDGPVREVAADRSLAGPQAALVTLYALTAMVEVRGQRVRMLLQAGSGSAVIGTRIWSTPRLAGAGGTLGGLAVAAVAGYLLMPAPAPAPVAQPVPAPVAAAPPGAELAIGFIRPPDLQASAAAEVSQQLAALAAARAQVPDGGRAAQPAAEAAHGAQAAHADAAAAPHPAAPPPATAQPAPAGKTPPAAAPPPDTRPVDVEPTLGRINMPALGLPGRRGDDTLASARERRLAAAVVQEPLRPAAPANSPRPGAAPGAALGGVPASMSPGLPSAPLALPGQGRPHPAQAAQPVQAAAAGPTAAPAAPAAQVAPPAPAPSHVATAPPPGSAFAVSSRLLRTRAEAEQTLSAMQALLASAGHATVHVELVPAGEDWRVVGWPFAQRAQADSARNLLAARGMRVTVIDF